VQNSEPFVKISFEIKSKDNDLIYTLYSGHCEIRCRNFIIVNTSFVPDPDRWIGGQSEALEVSSWINGLNIWMNPKYNPYDTINYVQSSRFSIKRRVDANKQGI
jgi:hypothetical protein